MPRWFLIQPYTLGAFYTCIIIDVLRSSIVVEFGGFLF
nr:MAG TPA: putative 2-phosphosulfolactate phosphatase [Caudoviricetes sp.]